MNQLRKIAGLASALAVACFIGATTSNAAKPEKAPKASVGRAAPEFTLKDTSGHDHKLSQYKGKYVVLEWFNDGCPYVQKHYTPVEGETVGNMQKLQSEFIPKGVVWLSINSESKSAQSAKAGFDEVKSQATTLLLDTTGTVGKDLYGAKTTPHMFIIDPKGTVIYAGAIDSIRSAERGDIARATNYVREALNQALSGKPVKTPTTIPYGCGVKYGA